MLDSRPIIQWNLEASAPLGLAGVVAAATVGAACVAAAGGLLANVASIPLLGFTAVWLHGRTVRRPTASRVESMLAALESRDRYTASHCSRVAAFADLIAEELGLDDPARLRNLRVAALLHDLGKLDVSLGILHKPGKLDEREWEEMRSHVQAGTRRASSLRREVCRIIAQHHERPDGKGYPRKLRGEEICLESRIVAVADAFDAMTSDRPYRRAMDPHAALEELRRSAGSQPGGEQFDPAVVEALERRFGDALTFCTPEAARHASPLS